MKKPIPLSATVLQFTVRTVQSAPTVSEVIMKNFNTLMLAIKLHKECKKPETPHYLKDQLLRSSSSAALNLSEGKGRKTAKDQKRFFDIAFGSLRETQTCLSRVRRINPKEKISKILNS